jgi:hypothetical protein
MGRSHRWKEKEFPISFTLIRECRPLGINGRIPYTFPLIYEWGRKSEFHISKKKTFAMLICK